MQRIDILELRTDESILLVIGDRAVEDNLACDAMIANRRRHGWIVRWIERVRANAGDGDDIGVALEARVHRPKDIVHVEGVDVLVDQKDMFEFTEGRESQECHLTLATFVGRLTFAHLQHAMNLPPPGLAQ